MNSPAGRIDITGFFFIAAFPLLATVVSYFLPFRSTQTAVIFLGNVCSTFCLQVYVNWFGAILPAAVAILVLPAGAKLFYSGSSHDIRKIVLIFTPTIIAIAGLGQTVVLSPVGIGLRFNPFLEVPCFLLFSAMLIYPSRLLGLLERERNQQARLIGGACLTLGFWVAIFLWNDLAGLVWFLATYSLHGSMPLVIGGGGISDGDLVIPVGLTVGFVAWVAYMRRRLQGRPRAPDRSVIETSAH